MKKEFLQLAIGMMVSCVSASTGLAIQDAAAVKSRAFEFKYAATITGLPKDAGVRIWLPITEFNGQQNVTRLSANTPPMQLNRDEKYHNLIGYFETKAKKNDDEVKFDITYDAIRNEAGIDDSAKQLTAQQKELFLSANAMVPIDGKPLELIKDIDLPTGDWDVGQLFFNIVDQHMKYDKSKPGFGDGNVLWACDSKTGNCTDFHSLFISLARSRSVPARLEIGFPLPSDKKSGTIGGYHCWAWFHVEGKGWVPVDISEADKNPEMKNYYFGRLTPDRIAFSEGRDIVLVPQSAAGPLNYFIYPHVEVNGKPWPKEKIKLEFSFRDQ